MGRRRSLREVLHGQVPQLVAEGVRRRRLGEGEDRRSGEHAPVAAVEEPHDDGAVFGRVPEDSQPQGCFCQRRIHGV